MAIAAETFMVMADDSPEFDLLRKSLACSSTVGFDAEWKPRSDRLAPPEAPRSFPMVTLLQIACREALGSVTRVFLVDLLALDLPPLWDALRDVFESQAVLKLGFRFKQDLIYLSSTFAAHGCDRGFDKVEPFIDITSVHHYLKFGSLLEGKGPPKQSSSLATICEEVLGVALSKDLQCSDWSVRPLTEEQKRYAAADAYYLLEIFDVFRCKFSDQVKQSVNTPGAYPPNLTQGLKDLFRAPSVYGNVLGTKYGRAVDMINSSDSESTLPALLDTSLCKIIKKYGEKIILQESDRHPRTSKRRGRKPSSSTWKFEVPSGQFSDWEGPRPWDSSDGGDEIPRFLCDVMVEGLAKYLRCVGIDAAVPSVKKPEARQLIEQAYKEKRVILTRDAKLLKHRYLVGNQIYRVRSLIKKDQLMEVIETFKIKISEEQLMSRCTKCNGRFVQKPLTIEEAVAASKGFQVIPSCLFNKDLEFWQCTDCGQLYWEGTQYQNAVQRFINVCKLSD
ncbi:3'-5' exonuclease domain-containing protein isoform X2 [Wolffia australiana]